VRREDGVLSDLVTARREFGDRHGGRSYRTHSRAGVPAGHISDRANRFPGQQLQHLTDNKQASQMSEISCGSVVVIAKDQVSCDLKGEAAILNLNDGMYYGLNEVGARIWSLLSEPITVSRIRDELEREYDVDSERCETDLVRLMSQLQDAGLIEVKNEGAA
jgi:hypothetical protein